MAAQILRQRESGLLQVYEIAQQYVSLFLLLPKSQGGTALNVGEYYPTTKIWNLRSEEESSSCPSL